MAKSGKPAANSEAATPIVCGALVLSPATHRAYWKEGDVGLTVSEYDVVHLLARDHGEGLGRLADTSRTLRPASEVSPSERNSAAITCSRS